MLTVSCFGRLAAVHDGLELKAYPEHYLPFLHLQLQSLSFSFIVMLVFLMP